MKSSTTPEGGETQVSTTTHDKKMPPATGTQRRHQNSGTLKMPANGILLAAEPCAGGAPPNGAYLVRLANKDQVNITEDRDTLHKVAT